MSEISNKFSLYEMLRIVIPGIYFSTMGCIAIDMIEFYPLIKVNTESFQAIIFIIFSILIGLLFYSWDIPKRINFFQADLPTRKIRKKHIEKTVVSIENSYFTYYDSLSKELKQRNEIYSGFYHFNIYISFVALIYIVGPLLYDRNLLFGFIIFNTMIFTISFATALTIYFTRLKYAFIRQLDGYYSSEQYKKLTEAN